MKLRFLLATVVLAAGAAFALAGAHPAGASVSSASGSGACIAHHPNYIENVFEVRYTSGCSGHDEPELDPLSDHAGSARDLTWKVVLPSNGSMNVDAVGPAFWFGGTVTEQPLQTGLRRAPVLPERARQQLHAERRLRAQAGAR